MSPQNPGTRMVLQWCRIFLLTMILTACHKSAKLNPSKLKRLPPVAQAKKEIVTVKKKKKKKVYLTFDDGPNRGTSKVLHISEEENVPISFFLVGEHVFASNTQHQMWDSLSAAPGIDLCNHSFTHALENHYERYYQDADTVVSDFKRCADSLRLTNYICRSPGRNSWRIDSLQSTDLHKSAAAIDSLQKAGFYMIGWDLEWHFDPKDLAALHSADEILAEIDSTFTKRRTKTPETPGAACSRPGVCRRP